MKVSKKAEYAMRAVLAIARAPQGSPVQIGELSQTESIPVKFLEQILLSLKKNGLLRSKRGAGGGYLLEQSPEEISLGRIRELVDGPFDPLGKTTGHDGIAQCFDQLRELVNAHLNDCSIRDLLDMERPAGVLAFEI